MDYDSCPNIRIVFQFLLNCLMIIILAVETSCQFLNIFLDILLLLSSENTCQNPPKNKAAILSLDFRMFFLLVREIWLPIVNSVWAYMTWATYLTSSIQKFKNI